MKTLSEEIKQNLIADVENICNVDLDEDTKIALARCFEITLGVAQMNFPSRERVMEAVIKNIFNLPNEYIPPFSKRNQMAINIANELCENNVEYHMVCTRCGNDFSTPNGFRERCDDCMITEAFEGREEK